MNEATKKALAEFKKIMDQAVISHAVETARANWEKSTETHFEGYDADGMACYSGADIL